MKFTFLTLIMLISGITFAQTRITTNMMSLRYATASDKLRVKTAFRYIESVVNKNSFRAQVLNATYTQTTSTPEEVLSSIIRGEENFPGGKPGVMDMYLEMYYEVDGAVGYTYANDPYVYMNRWVQSSYSPMETAGNLFHEWLHKLGHTHTYEWTEDRKESVPYKIGYLVRDMAIEEASKGDPLLKELMKKSFDSKAFENCSHTL